MSRNFFGCFFLSKFFFSFSSLKRFFVASARSTVSALVDFLTPSRGASSKLFRFFTSGSLLVAFEGAGSFFGALYGFMNCFFRFFTGSSSPWSSITSSVSETLKSESTTSASSSSVEYFSSPDSSSKPPKAVL